MNQWIKFDQIRTDKSLGLGKEVFKVTLALGTQILIEKILFVHYILNQWRER